MNERFQRNLSSLNYNKTVFLQFVTENNQLIDTQISCRSKHITNIHSTKFLGVIIDTFLFWKYRIQELKCKLNKACHAIRSNRSRLQKY